MMMTWIQPTLSFPCSNLLPSITIPTYCWFSPLTSANQCVILPTLLLSLQPSPRVSLLFCIALPSRRCLLPWSRERAPGISVALPYPHNDFRCPGHFAVLSIEASRQLIPPSLNGQGKAQFGLINPGIPPWRQPYFLLLNSHITKLES